MQVSVPRQRPTRSQRPRWVRHALAALLLLTDRASADLSLRDFAATVSGRQVSYRATLCSSTGATSTQWGIFHDAVSTPPVSANPDRTATASAQDCTGETTSTTLSWENAPIGIYRSYARIDPRGNQSESNEGNNNAGPIEVCVGPDVVLQSFEVKVSGASVTYETTVCNQGSMPARKFRVGVWHDESSAPAAERMGDVFRAIVELPPESCESIEIAGGLRPNGAFTAWARADSGSFIAECREGNNPRGPVPYRLSNPDLFVERFESRVANSDIDYRVRVCNKGTLAVGKFFVDLYYHRPEVLPVFGDPGDEAKSAEGLGPGACTDFFFKKTASAAGSFVSYALIDADEFISEPDEANNLSQSLGVSVTAGGEPNPPQGDCTDRDGDGSGVGPDCVGVPDCDDGDPQRRPGQSETCGDGIDNDCDYTVDDGCPGVDCVDGDGDGFGAGSGCFIADCNDSDDKVFPWANETCGDNDDDNCNGIADDGCLGRHCTDEDADGFGVGLGCPGPTDCAPQDARRHPDAEEICENGIDDDCDGVADEQCTTAVDRDGDGAVTGGDRPPYDCDDTNAQIAPNKAERCGDGVDNDCDMTIDDGCPGVDCVDKDGDGWGVGSQCEVADCDDNEAARHPWAGEVCGDNIDNDCDGTVDDGCPGVDCVDSDGDGWGTGSACSRQDCDDSNRALHPWAREICNDNLDNDCDRAIDEQCVLCQDTDGDGHGIGPRCNSWDCDDADPTTFPGASERCDGRDNNCDGQAEAPESCAAAAQEPTPQNSGCSHGLPQQGLAWLLCLTWLLRLRARTFGRMNAHDHPSGGALPVKDRKRA